MKISLELKKNLIADVENICNLNLNSGTKIALMRCFEITIGTDQLSETKECKNCIHDKNLKVCNNCQLPGTKFKRMSETKEEAVTDEEIMTYFNNHFNCYVDTSVAMPAMTRSQVLEMFHHFHSRQEPTMRDELKTICEEVEIYIQTSEHYRASIGLGYRSERFDEYLNSNSGDK